MSQNDYGGGGDFNNNYLTPTPNYGGTNLAPISEEPLLKVNRSNSMQEDVKKSFRQSWWRWVMLFFGCCFLLGSYFCYDNPGPIEKTLEDDLKISTV